jgi:hypothetical protein
MISSKKAAMEMSIGTIVTIVLSVTMLILGVVLIKNIFTGGEDIVNMGTDLAKSRVQTLLGEDERVVIYPDTDAIEIKQEKMGAALIGIKNLGSEETFSYLIKVYDIGNSCPDSMTNEKAMSLLESRENASDIMIPSGDSVSKKIIFKIPLGTPLCTIGYTVEVRLEDGTPYASKDFYIEIKAK